MNGALRYATVQDCPRDDLVERHISLVKRIAHHLAGRLPDSVQIDDLIQVGMIGLLEAARNFDGGQGATFETYATIRVRGAMLDEVRRNDWVPRSVHRRTRQMAEAVREVENREGRHARDYEIAAALDVSLEEYHQMLLDVRGHRVFSLSDTGDGDDALETVAADEPDVIDGLQREEMQRHLAQAIMDLPEKERLVMALYYDEGLNLREVGAVLGVSESRICQLHGQALLRLKARLRPGSTAATC